MLLGVYLVCYLGLAILCGFARGLMGVKVIGPLNLGYTLIIANYAVAWGLAVIYVRVSGRRHDALAAAAIAEHGAARHGVGGMSSATLAIFAAIIALTLGITAWAARRTRTANDFYTAGEGLSAAQNGFALAGDWCSAASFLGFSGLTALYGMDGALYAVGPLVAFCTVLFLVAEPIRNTGRYTLGDVINFRMRRKPALLAAALCTIVGELRLSGATDGGGRRAAEAPARLDYRTSVMIMGVAMIVYVTFGGQLATSWVQIVKAVLMLSAAALMLVLIASALGFHFGTLLTANAAANGADYLLPGNYLKNPFDQVSLALGYAFGLAGLPHVMTRFYTVPGRAGGPQIRHLGDVPAGSFFAATTISGWPPRISSAMRRSPQPIAAATWPCRCWRNISAAARARSAAT